MIERMKLKPKPSLDVDGPSIRIAWKDSDTLRAHWELTDKVKALIQKRFNIPIAELPFVIRLYDITDRDIRLDGLDHYVDFHINYQATEWLLYGIEEGRTYCVEFGVRMIDGRYYSLMRSNRL